METNKLVNKIETFLKGYEDKSDGRIKAADYLKGISMLYEVVVEENKMKVNSDAKMIINFNINLTDTEETNGDNN